VDNRVERVVLETGGQRIVGDLTLPREGYRSRLSDYLNQGDVDFIPLTDAEITGLDGREAIRREFVAIARSQVHLAYPLAGGDG